MSTRGLLTLLLLYAGLLGSIFAHAELTKPCDVRVGFTSPCKVNGTMVMCEKTWCED